jgi:curved DNA-binding protein CbpA
MKDLFATLGVSRNATTEQIKKAYKKRARCTHPDCCEGDDDQFRELQQAYELLSDPAKRLEHKQKLERPEPVRPRRPSKANRWSLEIVLDRGEASHGGVLDVPAPGIGRRFIPIRIFPGIRDGARLIVDLARYGFPKTVLEAAVKVRP